MHCFYHQDREAVGMCKSCSKGVCAECAADGGRGLACRGHCEEAVRALNGLVEYNIKMQPTASRLIQSGKSTRFVGCAFLVVMGGLFLAYGLSDERTSFIAWMGALFMAYGLFMFIWTLRKT